jgi:hypothetical protein
MSKILFSAIVMGALASTAVAQSTSTCAEYRASGGDGRLRMAGDLESTASQLSTRTFTEAELRTKLDTRCQLDPATILVRALEEVVE